MGQRRKKTEGGWGTHRGEGSSCSQAEAASEGAPSLGHIPRVPLTWLEKWSVSCGRSRSPFPGPSQNSKPMVTLSGLLSNRSPALSMVTLRLWSKPCPEREGGPGDAHRGPGVATGGRCPSVLRSPSVAFQGRALSLVGFGLLSHQGTWDQC